jgi:hypothetical protein
MRPFFFSLLICGTLYSQDSWADIPPDPEPATEDSGTEGEEKTGCSSIGGIDIGLSLFPILCLGWVALARKREDQ